MTPPDRRWDNDTRGHGDGTADWIVPDVHELVTALTQPGWVAEDPASHLLPHPRRVCEDSASPWTLVAAESRDTVYILTLEWSHPEPRLRQLRADVFALIGVIAEASTFVHQHLTDEAIEFHLTTGMLDGDSPFKAHGHLLQLRIGGPSVKPLMSGTKQNPTEQ